MSALGANKLVQLSQGESSKTNGKEAEKNLMLAPRSEVGRGGDVHQTCRGFSVERAWLILGEGRGARGVMSGDLLGRMAKDLAIVLFRRWAAHTRAAKMHRHRPKSYLSGWVGSRATIRLTR